MGEQLGSQQKGRSGGGLLQRHRKQISATEAHRCKVRKPARDCAWQALSLRRVPPAVVTFRGTQLNSCPPAAQSPLPKASGAITPWRNHNMFSEGRAKSRNLQERVLSQPRTGPRVS